MNFTKILKRKLQIVDEWTDLGQNTEWYDKQVGSTYKYLRIPHSVRLDVKRNFTLNTYNLGHQLYRKQKQLLTNV